MFSWKNLLFLRGKICHALAMAKFKRLHDLYRFPGFIPRSHIRGIFGDPLAVVISLRRRQKKRHVGFAADRTAPTTTSGPERSAISRVATSVFISVSFS